MALQLCHRSLGVLRSVKRTSSSSLSPKSSKKLRFERTITSPLYGKFGAFYAGNRYCTSKEDIEPTLESPLLSLSEEELEQLLETFPSLATPEDPNGKLPRGETLLDLINGALESEKDRIRHRTAENGKLTFPPWRMINVHRKRRKLVVVAGSDGMFGRTLKNVLKSRGHDVIGITRHSDLKWPYHADDVMQWWEVAGRRGVPDCDALVQVTGSPYLGLHTVPDKKFEKEQFETRGGITGLLAHRTEQTNWKPKVYIQASNTCIYPSSSTATYDESYSGPWATDLMGAVNADYENRAKLFQDQGIRTVHMRLGQIIADVGLIKDHYRIDSVGKAYWTRIGSGEQWFPWIHLIDAANMVIHAIEQENVQGALNAVAPEAIRQHEFAEELKRNLPSTTLKIPMPATIAHWRLPKRSHHILEGRKVVPQVALDTLFDYKYPTISEAIQSIQDELVPIQWKNPINTYFDPTKPDGKP